mgnify:CR=1 FL=1
MAAIFFCLSERELTRDRLTDCSLPKTSRPLCSPLVTRTGEAPQKEGVTEKFVYYFLGLVNWDPKEKYINLLTGVFNW